MIQRVFFIETRESKNIISIIMLDFKSLAMLDGTEGCSIWFFAPHLFAGTSLPIPVNTPAHLVGW